jgi:hypothetical protein
LPLLLCASIATMGHGTHFNLMQNHTTGCNILQTQPYRLVWTKVVTAWTAKVTGSTENNLLSFKSSLVGQQQKYVHSVACDVKPSISKRLNRQGWLSTFTSSKTHKWPQCLPRCFKSANRHQEDNHMLEYDVHATNITRHIREAEEESKGFLRTLKHLYLTTCHHIPEATIFYSCP